MREQYWPSHIPDADCPAAPNGEGRLSRTRPLQLHEYAAADGQRGAQLTRRGVFTVFLAREGSETLVDLRKVTQATNGEVERLAAILRRQVTGQALDSRRESTETLTDGLVLAQVRYGGATLASAVLCAENVGLSVLDIPHPGGYLDRAGFSLVEDCGAGCSIALDGLILWDSRPRTNVEEAARRALPPFRVDMDLDRYAELCFALSAMFIGPLKPPPVCIVPRQPKLSEARRTQIETATRSLGPAPSLPQLLALRRKLISYLGSS